jgi:hypothetical protein
VPEETEDQEVSDERKKFERWARECMDATDDDLEMRDNGSWREYVDTQIEAYWIGWQAKAEFEEALAGWPA